MTTGLPAGGPAIDGPAGIAERAAHMMGEHALKGWHGDEPMAWEGLLEVARHLRRGAEEVLAADDVSVSMLGIMGRLARAPRATLRQTALAEAMGLSISRVSRVIDVLEARGLATRSTCPEDARATNVTLSRRGRELTGRAQAHLFTYVQEAFAGRISPEEMSTLAAVFARLIAASH